MRAWHAREAVQEKLRVPTVRRTKLMELLWKLHPALVRATGGRIGGRIMGMPVLLLTTVGRKSGAPRTRALTYLARGDAAVVIASFAGEPRHPDWWLNLKKNPQAQIERDGRRSHVVAREAEGAERERLWQDVVAMDGGYAVYQQRTARRIPVVVLEPAAATR
jgi:deazaflavin-dependent oxidoreductase (nitroreductase family)